MVSIKMQTVHTFLSGTGVPGFHKDYVSKRKKNEYQHSSFLGQEISSRFRQCACCKKWL